MSAQQARQAWAIPDAGKLLVAGGVSGVLAKTATAPLGRLTILYQVRTGVQPLCSAGLTVAGLAAGARHDTQMQCCLLTLPR